MIVRFVTTTAEKLSSLPVVDGTIIALCDRAGYFYDHMGVRRLVGGIDIVSSLPEASTAGDGLYVLTEYQGEIIPGLYKAVDGEWLCLASDISDPPADNKYYVRRDHEWVEDHWTYNCTGVEADIAAINQLIRTFATSSEPYRCIKIQGELDISDTPIQLYAKENQTLVLDFQDAVVSNTIDMFAAYDSDSEQLLAGNIAIKNLHVGQSSKIIHVNAENIKIQIVDSSFVADEAGTNEIIVQSGQISIINCDFVLQSAKLTNYLMQFGQASLIHAEIARCNFRVASDLGGQLNAVAIHLQEITPNISIHDNQFDRCVILDDQGQLDTSLNNIVIQHTI